jgi:hypothetical protein
MKNIQIKQQRTKMQEKLQELLAVPSYQTIL